MVEDIRPPKSKPKKSNTKTKINSDAEPEFVPPEQIKNSGSEELKNKKNDQEEDSPKSKWRHPLRTMHEGWRALTPEHKVIAFSGFLFALIIISQATQALWPIKPRELGPVIVAKVEPPEPEPTTEPSKLTGLQVPFAVNKRPVIGVMIENSPDARPQAALKDAGVVYEAIAEGGITRFLALFLDKTPSYVGPARSARPYYVRWVLPYDAPYAHVGGSGQALSDIRRLGVKDLDQFHNPSAYWRVSSRYAPHNMYTSIDKLLNLAKKKGWKNSKFTGFAREEKELPEKFNATTINFDISSDLYDVQYKYNKKSNSYLRYLGGRKHTDEKSGKQLAPKVVIAMVTDYSIASNGIHSVYRTKGTGKAFVFQNGRVYKVTWKKTSDKGRLKFVNKKGEEFTLIPGQTWITVLAGADRVSYK